MNYKYFEEFKIEPHPFGTFIPKAPRSLIVGTFPTHQRNRAFEWFYGGVGNRFWEIMSVVLEHTFKEYSKAPAVNERKVLMEKHGIAMTDMVVRCYRKNDLSQDHNLYPIELQNILDILEKNPTIDTVVFTSRTRVIGALGLFETHLLQHAMKMPVMENRDGMLEGWYQLGEREISLLVPYSPSKTLAEKEFASTNRLIEMYSSCSLRNG